MRLFAAVVAPLVIAGCGGPPTATAVAIAIPDPVAEPMPAAGTYRVRWLPDHQFPITAKLPGIRMGSGTSPRRTWVQVDYTGPRRHVELVAVNRVGDERAAPEPFHRAEYGAADLEISGSNARYFDNEPFSRPRQTFVIEIHPLTDCTEATALASVYAFDSVERSFYDAARAQFYMAAWDPAHAGKGTSFGEGPVDKSASTSIYPGPSKAIPDGDATTLLHVSRGDASTEIQLRFRN